MAALPCQIHGFRSMKKYSPNSRKNRGFNLDIWCCSYGNFRCLEMLEMRGLNLRNNEF